MGRTFQEIADEIDLTWNGVNRQTVRAGIYLEALQEFDTTDPEATRGGQRAKDLVLGFLQTAYCFKGRDSYRLKRELRDAAGIEFNIHKSCHVI